MLHYVWGNWHFFGSVLLGVYLLAAKPKFYISAFWDRAEMAGSRSKLNSAFVFQ